MAHNLAPYSNTPYMCTHTHIHTLLYMHTTHTDKHNIQVKQFLSTFPMTLQLMYKLHTQLSLVDTLEYSVVGCYTQRTLIINGHGTITLVVPSFCSKRAIHWDLSVVWSQPVSVSVIIREQTTLTMHKHHKYSNTTVISQEAWCFYALHNQL